MKKIPFFDYPRLWNDHKNFFLSTIDNVASSGGFILQKEVTNFENELAKFTGVNYSVGVGNATDAMEIFLEAIGIKKGDEIIISSSGQKIRLRASRLRARRILTHRPLATLKLRVFWANLIVSRF